MKGGREMLDSSYLQIGARRQFFFDDLVIASAQDLTRRHHMPRRTCDGPLISRDRPWEKTLYFTCNTWNVIRDPEDGLFKCWYENWLLEDAAKLPSEVRHSDGKVIVDAHGAAPSCVCFARSKDGLHWEKPEMDIVLDGGARTNIVLGMGACADQAHCATLLLDPLEADTSRRYKALFMCGLESTVEGTTGTAYFAVATSPDGCHWRLLPDRPVFGVTDRSLGDVVTITADPASRTYWLNNRHPGMCTVPSDPACPPTRSWISPYAPRNFARQNKRRVFRSQSADLIHWSHPRPLIVPDDALDNIDDAFYGMEQFRIGDDWLGSLNVLHMTDNTMDVQLVYSRDGCNFERIRPGQAWLTRGGPGSWDANMVSICSKPVLVGDDLYVYHGGTASHHDWWMVGPAEGLEHQEVRATEKVKFGLGLATMKRDRFVSLDTGPVREGVLITHPIRPRGSQLVINAACRQGGSVLAELTDPAGRVLGGFEKQNCLPFRGDCVDHVVHWKAGRPTPAGEFLRLRLFLRQAEVFSFQFSGTPGG